MSNRVCKKGYSNNLLTTEQQADNGINSRTLLGHLYGFKEHSLRGF